MQIEPPEPGEERRPPFTGSHFPRRAPSRPKPQNNPTMKLNPLLRIAALACCFFPVALPAQQPATPSYAQTIYYLRVTPGKDAEFMQFVNDTFRKVAQVQVDAGEIHSWTFMRAVMPAGQDSRADYVVSIVTEGAPSEPVSAEALAAAMAKGGIAMSIPEFIEKRTALATLVSSEMCRIQARAGAPKKGHYLLVNQMKVHDAAAQIDYARTIRRPIAEELVRQGTMSGWMLATRILTVGTETPNLAFSVDMYPTWQALFAPRSIQKVFEKVHAGKDFEHEMSRINKYREVTRRDLWVVVDRVEKST